MGNKNKNSNTRENRLVDGMIKVSIGIIIAVVSSLCGVYFSKNQELYLRLNQQKMSRYENLIKYAQKGFLFDENITDEDRAENKGFFYNESYLVWLYASDEVIKALNDFSKAITPYAKDKKSENQEEATNCLRKVIYSMRKDLQEKTTLEDSEVTFVTIYSQDAASK